MRILLVVNIVLPKAAHLIDREQTVFGGWLTSLVEGISEKTDVEVAVAAPYDGDALKSGVVDDVTYYFLPRRDLFDVSMKDCDYVFDHFKPDILHIEGSEFKHANTFIRCWQGKNILSLQGVVNGIYPYFEGGLPLTSMLFSINISQMICSISIIVKKRVFRSRLASEIDTLKRAQNILGRTMWDQAHARKFNSKAPYYTCNRILRQPFYNGKWSIDQVERNSIYVGNSYQPLKGFHFIVQAVSILKKRYPKIKVYVAGVSPWDERIRRNLLKNGYALYLRSLIDKMDLSGNFIFLGSISAEEVVSRLERVHVYCLASSIENSPNTLAEAMLLGVPSIASFVGGVSDMATDNLQALLYRFDEVDVLVNQVSRIFDDDTLAIALSDNARIKALETHSREDNVKRMYDCYLRILKEE